MPSKYTTSDLSTSKTYTISFNVGLSIYSSLMEHQMKNSTPSGLGTLFSASLTNQLYKNIIWSEITSNFSSKCFLVILITPFLSKSSRLLISCLVHKVTLSINAPNNIYSPGVANFQLIGIPTASTDK